MRRLWARLQCWAGYHDWVMGVDLRTGDFQGWYCLFCGKGRDAVELEQ